jgi:hypothetical protein
MMNELNHIAKAILSKTMGGDLIWELLEPFKDKPSDCKDYIGYHMQLGIYHYHTVLEAEGMQFISKRQHAIEYAMEKWKVIEEEACIRIDKLLELEITNNINNQLNKS